MPEYLAPGVFIEEIPSGFEPIEGVPTTVLGLVGPTQRGPNEVREVGSWAEFRREFGEPIDPLYTAHAAHGFFENGGTRCFVARVANDSPTVADFEGRLEALAAVDEISLLAVPDEHRLPGLRESVVAHCESMGDRFGIFSVAPGTRDVSWIRAEPPTTSGALYWPWIRVRHPSNGSGILVPPVGHVAGVIARTDVERGVHKAPANRELRGALDLEFPVTQEVQEILSPRGVNVIRDFRDSGRGILVWGARTMSSDPEWKYVNIRRLFMFLEESIEEGTRWAMFEPNGQPLWDKVRRAVESFLFTQWRAGVFQGVTPEKAFFVKCDRTTMTQNDIDDGRLICLIGVAALKPAEFVIFRIGQKTMEAPD